MTYDLVTGQRTFYLGLSGVSPNPNNVIHDVIFRDSGGNDIKCSYFRINALVDATVANSGAWAAELSGIPHTGDMLTDSLSSVSNTVATSGICGIGGAMGPIGQSRMSGMEVMDRCVQELNFKLCQRVLGL